MKSSRRRHASVTDHLALLAVGLSALWWILESTIHAVVFQKGSFLKQVFPSDPHEAWMRFFVVVLFVVFGTYGQFLIRRRRRAEAALRESEQWFSTTLHSIGDAVIATDAEGFVKLMNPVAEELTGWKAEDAARKPLAQVFEIISEKTGKRAEDPIARIVREGVVVGLANHTILVGKDGTKRPIDDSGAPIRNEAGRIRGAVLVFRDITERRRAEEALRESEEWLSTTLRSIGDAVIATDVEGRVKLMNPVAEELTGWTQDEAAGRPVTDVFHIINEKTGRKAENPVIRVLREGIVVGLANHTVLISKDGTRVPLDDSGAPIRDRTGRVIGAVLVFRDVTARRQAEEKLQASEERLRMIIEASKDAIIAVDDAGKIAIFNQAAEEMFGHLAAEVLGGPLEGIIPPEFREKHQRMLTGFLSNGVSRCGHISRTVAKEAIRADGTRFPVELSLSAGRSNGVRMVIAVMRDITERKRTEDELSRYRSHLEDLVAERTQRLGESQQQLRRAERLASIGTLAAGIAHEINNPVGAILIAAENALEFKDGRDFRKKVRQSLTRIVDNAKRCGQIVKSVLQFARQETTRKWPNDLNAILQHAVEVTRSYAKDPDVVIGLELSEGIPRAVVNPIEIEQVFVNLIRNAIESGDPATRVRVLTEKTATSVRVVIQDSGRGLTQEQRKNVFDPFYTTRREQGGMGLGLSISHGIVAEHGGTIDIQSKPGEGTTVTVSLPFEVGP